MQNNSLTYGCLVRVGDMNRVRAFYRDTLELGDPIVDSNFWLEFRLPGNGILAIEQSSAAGGEGDRVDVSVLIGVEDVDAIVKTLKDKAVKPTLPAREIPGLETASIKDPEGNVITFYNRGEVVGEPKNPTIKKAE